MDLLGQVLIRLPLQRLHELHDSEEQSGLQSRVINGKLLALRAGLRDPAFVSLNDVAESFRLLELSGELTMQSQLHVSVGALMERAIFLRDITALRYYAGIYPFTSSKSERRIPATLHLKENSSWLLQNALQTNDPEIIAIILALVENTREIADLIPPNPWLIKWTPGLRKWYGELCRLYFNSEVVQNRQYVAILAGFLQLWPIEHIPKRLGSDVEYYIDAYVKSEIANSERLHLICLSVKKAFPKVYGLHILSNGMIFHSESYKDPLLAALCSLIPDVIEYLLENGGNINSMINPLFPLPDTITETTVENARRILKILTPELARERGIYPSYLVYLRVLCGLHIDPDEMPLHLPRIEEWSDYEGTLNGIIMATMTAVMHPEIREIDIVDSREFNIPSSNIHYDPKRFIRLVGRPLSDMEAVIAYKYGLGQTDRDFPDCGISVAHVRRAIRAFRPDQDAAYRLTLHDSHPGLCFKSRQTRSIEPFEIHSVAEILQIEEIVGEPLYQHDQLLENALKFEESVQRFRKILTD